MIPELHPTGRKPPNSSTADITSQRKRHRSRAGLRRRAEAMPANAIPAVTLPRQPDRRMCHDRGKIGDSRKRVPARSQKKPTDNSRWPIIHHHSLAWRTFEPHGSQIAVQTNTTRMVSPAAFRITKDKQAGSLRSPNRPFHRHEDQIECVSRAATAFAHDSPLKFRRPA